MCIVFRQCELEEGLRKGLHVREASVIATKYLRHKLKAENIYCGSFSPWLFDPVWGQKVQSMAV